MRLIIESNYEALSKWAARYVIDRINAAKPTTEHPFILGLPTGSSPEGMYATNRKEASARVKIKIFFNNYETKKANQLAFWVNWFVLWVHQFV